MRVAFDIVGGREGAIAIITNLNMTAKEAKVAAEYIMDKYGHVRSVVRKVGKRSGKYRTFKIKHLLGKKNLVVVHKEYGYKLKLHLGKVHFSPREGDERERIVKQVKDGEKILYLFSGVAPYAVAIAKKRKVEITCIEWNPTAVRYAKENIKLNKLKGVRVLKRDVKKFTSKEKFDRIIMPLGLEAIDYLKFVDIFVKKGTIIHLYGTSGDGGKDLSKQVKMILKRKFKVVNVQKVANFSP